MQARTTVQEREQLDIGVFLEPIMANVFDDKKDKKLINEFWKEGTFPRKSFTRSLSEKEPPSSQKNSNRDKAMDPVELPISVSSINIDRESREKEAERFSRHLSSSLNQLTSIPQTDEPNPFKVGKTISNSDSELKGMNFVAMNNERNSTMVNKSKLEQRNSSNQTFTKGRKSFKRRASMPANYLGDYLSVNNIRKRAHFLGTSDTDGETLSKVKNAGSRRRVKVLPTSPQPSLKTEEADEPERDLIEIEISAENEIKDETRPNIEVGFVTLQFSFVTVHHYEVRIACHCKISWGYF